MASVQQGVKTNVVLYTAAAVLGFGAFAMAVANLLSTVKQGALTITNVTINPAQPKPGDMVIFDVTVQNTTKNAATAAKLYVSWDGNDCKKGCYSEVAKFGKMKKGESRTVQAGRIYSVAGDYSILLKADNGAWKDTVAKYTFSVASVDANPEIISFVANPSSIKPGQSTTLSWVTKNTAHCDASGDWTGAKSIPTGSDVLYFPLPASAGGPQTGGAAQNIQTYILTCYNSQYGGQSVSRPVTVTIGGSNNYCDQNKPCPSGYMCQSGLGIGATCVPITTGAKPDLKITQVTWGKSTVDVSGSVVRPTVTVKNFGQGTAALINNTTNAVPAAPTCLQISHDGPVVARIIPSWQCFDLPNGTLKAGESVTQTLTEMNFVKYQGTYLTFKIDSPINQVSESNEENNTYPTLVSIFGVKCGPDHLCPAGFICQKSSDVGACSGSGCEKTIAGTAPTSTDNGTCVPGGSLCGNGVLEAGEECDDGNRVDGDQCSSVCKTTIPNPGGLSVSCSASPNPANVGQNVYFKSYVTGGSGKYAYEWTGACKGYDAGCTTSFQAGPAATIPATYSAVVAVRDVGGTIATPATVTGSGTCSVVVKGTGGGTQTCGPNGYQCDAGLSCINGVCVSDPGIR